jgi:hypothetical protein
LREEKGGKRSRREEGREAKTHLNLLISHPIAHPRIELIQTLPRQLLIRQLARGLDSPPQRWGPDLLAHIFVSSARERGKRGGGSHGERSIAELLFDERWEGAHVLFALDGEGSVTANLAIDVVLRFAVLSRAERA